MSLEPVWAVKCPTITVVVSRLDGAVLMLPSKMPLILEGFGGLPTEGKALLLVGFKAWFQGPPACAHQAGCRTMPLTACLERDFGRACLACWQPKGSLEGFLDAGFQLIHVSSQAVVRAAAAPPPATAQEARDHLSSAALAIALVRCPAGLPLSSATELPEPTDAPLVPVTASCAGTLREIALDLPLSWHSPGSFLAVLHHRLLHACDWVPAGTELLLIACGPKPPNTRPAIRIPKNLGTNMGEVPAEVRLEALRGQAQWLADDQISFLLDVCAAESGRAILVVDPLLASAALHNSSPAPFEEALAKCPAWAEAITVAWHLGHWIAFHWKREGCNILAWSSTPMKVQGGIIDEEAPRPAEPGFCGYFALADLRARLHSAAYLTSTEAVQSIGNALGPFVAGLDTRDGASRKTLLKPGSMKLCSELVIIPEGEFEHDGNPLSQISLREAYLSIAKPVSSKALGLLVFGQVDLSIGDRFVQKRAPAKVETLELPPSSIVRVAIYRDEWAGPWSLVQQKPIRALLEACSRLQTCTQVGCQCEQWHGTSDPGVPEALLEVWGRSYVSESMRLRQLVFSMLFCVSQLACWKPCWALRGEAASTLSPEAMKPGSIRPSVAWTPKATRQEVTLARQSTPQALGIARIGQRFGVRSKVEHAEEVHSLLKPASTYFKQEWALTFHAGPWPYGSQRGAIAKVLESCIWKARPSGDGQWWAIKAETSPPQAVLHLQQGEILVSEAKAKPGVKGPVQEVLVAPRAVLEAVATPGKLAEDPLQINDPWAAAAAAAKPNPGRSSVAATASNDFGAMARSLEAKLSAQVRGARVQALESSVATVTKKVDGQEAALTAAFQSLFEQQTARIEELLGPKRQRHEPTCDPDEGAETFVLGIFRNGLKYANAPFRFSPGPPAPPRARSPVTGDYTGVGFLSSFPCRASPCDFAADLVATARLHVASFLLGSTWILGAAIYGLPVAPAATETLLQAATTRVVLQGQGPRFLAGDFNLEPEAQQLAPFWEQHGFLDVQDLWHRRCGQLPQVTCKASTRKDFLYVSAEFHHLLEQVTVDDTWFCDHAVLSATFRLQGLRQPCPIWRMPRPRQLPSDMQLPLPACVFPALAPDGDPSQSYRLIWEHYENHLSHCLQLAGNRPLSKSERGRAETTEVTVVVRQATVVPVGCKPLSKVWLRALPRTRLWAPGFFPNFRAYWPTRSVVSVGDPAVVPVGIPGLATARALFAAFQANVNAMEKHLQKTRKREAKARRAKDPMMIFRDIGSGRAAPVESIVEGVSAKVSAVDPACGSVGFAADVDWQADAGFLLNQKPVEVHHAEPDMLWGDFALAKVGDVISQQTPTASLPALFRAFGGHWSRFWLKHEQVDPDTWRRFGPSWRPPQFPIARPTTPLPRFCPGGYDARPLGLASPYGSPHPVGKREDTDGAVVPCDSGPFHLFNGSDRGFNHLPWPRTGAFGPVAKGNHLLSETHWQGQEVGPRNTIGTGGGKGMLGTNSFSPPFNRATPLVGAFLDLSKAFNTLPRAPVFALALHYGVPAKVVKAWSGAVATLTRRFRIRGATGPALPSFTGFAEGDPLSCLAMAAVDLALHRRFEAKAETTSLDSFVDDWQLQGAAPDAVIRAVGLVEEFTRGWDLTLDPSKMIMWATDPLHRRELRRAGHNVAHSARSLGGHIATTRARSNGTLQGRVAGVDKLWPQLRSSPAPLSQKVRALHVGAWPRALHAVSSTNLGDTLIGHLRSGAMKGLGLEGPGVNPDVALSLVCYPLADPGYFVLESTFRDLRAFGLKERVVPMIEELLASTSRWSPGPIQVFLERCFAVGISWNAAEAASEDSISCFDLWDVSPQELRHRLVFAWQKRVCSQVSSRPGFAGLTGADPQHTAALKKGWSPTDCKHAFNTHTGAFFTQDALRYFGDGPTECASCKYCGALDSVRHRVWHCPRFDEARNTAAAACLPDPGTLPEAMALRAWVMRPAPLVELWRLLAAIPDTTCELNVPATLEPLVHLFTDGSCFLPGIPQLRLASWAVICMPTTGQPATLVSAGPVWGLIQTAFRGEITGVLSALSFAVTTRMPVCIWCDCAGVVRTLRRMLDNGFCPRSQSPNSDLWRRVFHLARRAPAGTTIRKVTAHVELDMASDVAEEWAAQGNDAADKAATVANWNRDPAFWEVWEDVRKDYVVQDLRGRAVLELHRTDPPVGYDCDIRPLPGALPRHLGRFGGEYICELHAWLQTLAAGNGGPKWVSFLHLYAAFVFDTARIPPIYNKRSKHWEHFPSDDLRIQTVSLGERVRYFRRHVKAIIHAVAGKLSVQETRPDSAALAVKVACAFVVLPQGTFDRIESWLVSQLPNGACVQQSREWTALPFPPVG
ncbi:Pol [Symbiodinium sp. CCMP2592]|nr:Pol [Symbiodinium sp. CCMP2592]